MDNLLLKRLSSVVFVKELLKVQGQVSTLFFNRCNNRFNMNPELARIALDGKKSKVCSFIQSIKATIRTPEFVPLQSLLCSILSLLFSDLVQLVAQFPDLLLSLLPVELNSNLNFLLYFRVGVENSKAVGLVLEDDVFLFV
jgi:hypothetical protein